MSATVIAACARRRGHIIRLFPVCLVIQLIAWAAPSAAVTDLDVAISAPADGTVIAGGPPRATVRGRTGVHDPQGGPRHDVMLILDTSGSTREPSGADINGNGVVGRLVPRSPGFLTPRPSGTSDPGDSILAAEVAAGERLLRRLDPGTTRVGVVGFSGSRPGGNAVLEQPLTRDFDAVRSALQRIQAAGGTGGTDMAAGVRLAVRELAGLTGHVSEADAASRKVGILLTDGFPTLPFGGGQDRDARDVEVAVNAARVAARAAIRIHTFGLGEAALAAPQASREIARVTGGRYTPIATPGHVVALMEKTSFTGVDIVLLRNITTGHAATDLRLTPDGLFTAEVGLAPGANRIAVDVLATDGTKATAAIVIHYRTAGALDLELSRQNRALERRLDQLRERTRALEAEAERQRALELEIQRGRPAGGN